MEQPKNDNYIKGRGAQINPTHRFAEYAYDGEENQLVEEEEDKKPTNYIDVHPKSILNKVVNPDIPAEYSMNPYQGCEHGCVYCYARNTHPYWGPPAPQNKSIKPFSVFNSFNFWNGITRFSLEIFSSSCSIIFIGISASAILVTLLIWLIISSPIFSANSGGTALPTSMHCLLLSPTNKCVSGNV